MPTTTRGPRTGRIPTRSTATPTGRFGRSTGAPTGRFGRQASTSRNPGGATTGRSGRTSQRPSGRRSSPNRQGIMSGKFGPIAKPAPKGIGKLTSKLPGVSAGASRGRGSRKRGSGAATGGKVGAGAALLTAAAGLAFKNRDKLAGVVKRRGEDSHTVAPASPSGTGTMDTTATGGMSDANLNGPVGGMSSTDPDAPGMGGRTSPA